MSDTTSPLQDPQSRAVIDFFSGVRAETPVPPVKSEGGTSPCYLDYTANLDGFAPILPLYPPKGCKPKFLVLQCSCGRRIVPSTCMSLDCDPCRGAVGKRRASMVLRRLLGDTVYQRRRHWCKTVIYTIFTVPAHIRERFLDPKVWQKARKKAWQILKENYGAAYGVEASHPSGDKKSFAFHPHLNFLWVQKSGSRPFINVDLLRRKWSEVLKVELSDVYSQYSSDVPLIAHWAKYVTRTFPGTHKWSGSMRWYGKYPKLKKPEQCTCSDCGTYFHFIGYVTAQDIDEWVEVGQRIGRDPPWERDECIVFH
ncbi:hypothetical protein ES703_49557 [subsurface metagenome]